MDTNPNTKKPAPDKNEPGKYIRTFAGDIKTMKEGGIPDLVPLTPSVKSASPISPATPERPSVVIPVAPLPPPVSPIQAPLQIRKPPPPPLPPIPKPIPVAVKTPIEPPVFSRVPPSMDTLQTYSGDFSQKMKDTRSSMATVLAAEQDSATGDPQPAPPKSSPHGLLYGIAGTVLFIAAGVGVYFSYIIYLAKTPIVVFAPVVSAPIFVDDREQLSGTGPELSHAISESVARTIPVGAVRLIYIKLSTTTPDSVFSALHAPAPDILLRNVNVTGSMAGVVNAGGSQSPFFILSVASYSETFAGMLSWEPKIAQDLKELFPVYSIPIPSVSLATSTVGVPKQATTTPSIPIKRLAFLDEVVANHDVRIYRDAAGRDVLLYGYWNQTTLVIARDSSAFTEILQRLATSRAQ